MIEGVQFQRDLGVIFDSKFSFEKHIETVTAKAFVSLGFMKRFSKHFTFLCKKTLFSALVRPQLEYATQVWAPYQVKYHLMIERVQKNFTIWALNLSRDPITHKFMPYNERNAKFGFVSLMKRRAFAAANWLYDVIEGGIDSSIIRRKIIFNENVRNLRNIELLKMGSYRNNYLKQQPIQRMISFFNKISFLYRSAESRTDFRRKIRSCDTETILY